MNKSENDDMPPRDEAPATRSPPSLLATVDLPQFAEEGARDPFGQNAELLDRASRRAFELGIRIATRANARGFAMMLPVPAPGSIDPSVRPWRSIVSCEPDEHELDVENIPPPAVHWRGLHSTAIQTLTQRAALCVAALDDYASQEACDQLAEMLEELGYIALSREHHDRRIDAFRPTKMPFRFFYTIGEIAARLYEINVIHGDMTTSNFLYDEQQRTAVISDVGTTCFLKRPITMEEHAADVGLMKLTCSFEEWEAVKLGYRNRAPDRAARLFQLI